MKRCEMLCASLCEALGSEPGYSLPVGVISSLEFNKRNIKTVFVAVVTSNLRLADAPGNFAVSKKESGLSKESVVNVSQLLTLDESFLVDKAGKLPSKMLVSLNEGLKLVLSI